MKFLNTQMLTSIYRLQQTEGDQSEQTKDVYHSNQYHRPASSVICSNTNLSGKSTLLHVEGYRLQMLLHIGLDLARL